MLYRQLRGYISSKAATLIEGVAWVQDGRSDTKMRMCPKCRLITADDAACVECGWNAWSQTSSDTGLTAQYSATLQYLSLFSAGLFAASFLIAFMTRHGSTAIPALAAGLFTAGVVADVFLVWVIYRASA